MPGKRRRRRKSAGKRPSGALAVVRQARSAAKKALDSLREEIKSTQSRLEQLVSEEKSFREELFGAVRGAAGRLRSGRRGRKTKDEKNRPRQRRGTARRGGPPKAERYFDKLPNRFTLDDVRKLAGRASGVSIAQWSRAKRIRKTANGYHKTAR